jgi:hypothetical protein
MYQDRVRWLFVVFLRFRGDDVHHRWKESDEKTWKFQRKIIQWFVVLWQCTDIQLVLFFFSRRRLTPMASTSRMQTTFISNLFNKDLTWAYIKITWVHHITPINPILGRSYHQCFIPKQTTNNAPSTKYWEHHRLVLWRTGSLHMF